MENEIKRLYDKGINNPYGICTCLYSMGFTGRIRELRKIVIKEIDRIKKIKQHKD